MGQGQPCCCGSQAYIVVSPQTGSGKPDMTVPNPPVGFNGDRSLLFDMAYLCTLDLNSGKVELVAQIQEDPNERARDNANWTPYAWTPEFNFGATDTPNSTLMWDYDRSEFYFFYGSLGSDTGIPPQVYTDNQRFTSDNGCYDWLPNPRCTRILDGTTGYLRFSTHDFDPATPRVYERVLTIGYRQIVSGFDNGLIRDEESVDEITRGLTYGPARGIDNVTVPGLPPKRMLYGLAASLNAYTAFNPVINRKGATGTVMLIGIQEGNDRITRPATRMYCPEDRLGEANSYNHCDASLAAGLAQMGPIALPTAAEYAAGLNYQVDFIPCDLAMDRSTDPPTMYAMVIGNRRTTVGGGYNAVAPAPPPGQGLLTIQPMIWTIDYLAERPTGKLIRQINDAKINTNPPSETHRMAIDPEANEMVVLMEIGAGLYAISRCNLPIADNQFDGQDVLLVNFDALDGTIAESSDFYWIRGFTFAPGGPLPAVDPPVDPTV